MPSISLTSEIGKDASGKYGVKRSKDVNGIQSTAKRSVNEGRDAEV